MLRRLLLRRLLHTPAGQLRRGQVVTFQHAPHIVTHRDRHMTGRGGSIIKVELKDVASGRRRLERFNASDELPIVTLHSTAYQFLYRDRSTLHLMHPDSFEPLEVDVSLVEGDDKHAQLLQDNMLVHVQSIAENPEQPLSLRLPAHAAYTVARDEPIAGQAAKGVAYKAAFIAASGGGEVRVMVPEFVQVGDAIVLDTEHGEYLRRATASDLASSAS